MGTLANNEDPDEMLKKAAFYQGHCLLGIEVYLIFEILTLIYTMNHPST